MLALLASIRNTREFRDQASPQDARDHFKQSAKVQIALER